MPRDSNFFRKKKHKSFWKFFKLLQKLDSQKDRGSFKVLQKQNARVPPDSFKLLQKLGPWGVSEILSNYFKNKTQEASKFFQITSKTRPTRGPRDSFNLFQKLDPQSDPDSFKLLQKQNTRDRNSFRLLHKLDPLRFRRFSQSTSRTRPIGVPEILLNNFKKKT